MDYMLDELRHCIIPSTYPLHSVEFSGVEFKRSFTACEHPELCKENLYSNLCVMLQ